MRLEIAIKFFIDQYDNSGTRQAYKSCLYPLANAIGATTLVADIRPVHLVEYVATLRDKNYSQATRNKHIKAIRALFTFLVGLDVLPTSPAKSIKTRTPARNISRDKAMTESELKAILRQTWHKPRDYALILFLADTGCRAGGVARLTIDDLDIANRRAMVTEKGEKTRPVVYGEETATAIRQWLLRRKLKGRYVFAHKQKPLSSAQVGQIVRRACLSAGVRSLGSHSLRHRKGHQFADAKIAPSVAATALGHSNVTITLTHYYPSDFESAEKALKSLAVSTNQDSDDKIVTFRTS